MLKCRNDAAEDKWYSGGTGCLAEVSVQMTDSGAGQLTAVQMYRSLPHYIPRAVIEFPCTLGDLVTKNIELTNPSKNPISYWVNLDGCRDFTIEEQSLRIEPGGVINFPIRF